MFNDPKMIVGSLFFCIMFALCKSPHCVAWPGLADTETATDLHLSRFTDPRLSVLLILIRDGL